MAVRSRGKARPFWERGYKSHGYWAGKRRLGVVRLCVEAVPEDKYRWEAGTHAGFAVSLIDAKRAVEGAVLLGQSQLSLFQDEVQSA